MGIQRTIVEKTDYGNESNIRFSIRGPLYDGSKNSMSRVTINMSKRERPLTVLEKLLVTSYSEIPSFELSVLDVGGIAAEKIRCILTREKPRDVYDLWFLSKKDITLDVTLVDKKLKSYSLTFNQKEFMEKVNEKRHMWRRDLKDLIIGTLPEFHTVTNEVESWCKTWI